MYLSNNACYFACPLGTYRNDTSMLCTGCDSTCSACTGSGNSKCTKCINGYVLDNTTCTSGCPAGQKANSYGVCTWASRALFCVFAVITIALVW